VFSQLGRLPKGRLPEAAESRWDLMVGDTEFDILAGKAAGVTTCAVRWSEIPHERLLGAGPDHFVDEFAQVVALIKQQVQALRS
jgi:phosphoglycolate phosphatase-like HAD superfamily hydrolase